MPDLRWVAAGVATVTAAVVVGIAIANSGDDAGPAVVTDQAGDVVGAGRPEVQGFADLERIRLAPVDDGYRVTIRFSQPLDRSLLADEPARYEVRMVSASRVYVLRVLVAQSRLEAVTVDTASRERPFVLGAPRISGRDLTVDLSSRSLRGLPDHFSWGATAAAGGWHDRAPSDLSARYPG